MQQIQSLRSNSYGTSKPQTELKPPVCPSVEAAMQRQSMNAIAPVQFEFRSVNKESENNQNIVNSKPPLVKGGSTKYS